MRRRLRRLRDELGPLGLAGLVLLALAALALAFVVHPLEQKSRALEAALERAAPHGAQPGPSKLDTLYRYLERGEETTDWLAKLHAIGRATGVQMRSATYRTQAAGARLERYEIVLPVSGSYAQIREFLNRALSDIPVLSLDHVSLKRERRTDGVVQAELRLALHRMK